MHDLLVAAAEHAPPVDHAVVLIAVILIAACTGLVYGLRCVVGKTRAGRTRSDRPEADRPPRG